jgi:hypothetical protein
MQYWLFNAEQANGLPCDAADVWFHHNMGFSGNDRKKYGEPLSRLNVGDFVLMYQNEKGVVGLGTVAERWNGKGYKRKLVYLAADFPEYRIRVDWHHDLRQTPFDLGWSSPKFLCSLKKPELVARVKEAIRLAKLGHSVPPSSDEADVYTPTDVDERELIRQQIKKRRGQQQFRRNLAERYGRRCQVTGCPIFDIVEAAHIQPYRGKKDNHADNGLLLRADIHTLFDLDLIGIKPRSLEIVCADRVKNEYGNQIETKLNCGGNGRPSAKALKTRYARFREMQRSGA